jgi:hypothetical protein
MFSKAYFEYIIEFQTKKNNLSRRLVKDKKEKYRSMRIITVEINNNRAK